MLVKSFANAAFGDTSHTESICLEEGEYEFTIQDVAGDGICCGVTQGYGNYNITSNGSLIVEGGEFGRSESTTFTIPLTPAPSEVPSMMPTSSMIPTISPTSPPTTSPSHPPSLPPTISKTTPSSTLYYIEVTVLYDDNPWQTSWKLQRVIGNGFVNGDVKSHAGAPGDTSHTEQIWIPEGLYKFTIMDTHGMMAYAAWKETDLTSS